jgi:copper homeostasis protein
VRLAGSHPVIFHRAFDFTPDATKALEELIDLGIRRVMTSGQECTALAGAARIGALVQQAAGRIEVLPAGGIRSENVVELLRQTGCTQIHAGLRGIVRDASALIRPEVDFSSKSLASDLYEATDGALVRALREAIDSV